MLDRISFSVERGEVVTIVGPNGAGKTTLLRAIAGVRPFDGTIRLDGESLHTLSPRRRARTLAYLPQETESPFAPTVRELVRLGRYAHRGAWRALDRDDLAAIDAALERTGLAALADRTIDTLSGGERRRAFLARALAQSAPLLVLDEPTTALDIGHATFLIDWIRDLAAHGRTVLMSLHDVAHAARSAERVILLDRGSLVADGPPLDVLTSELARRAFGVRLCAVHNPQGQPVIVSESSSDSLRSAANNRPVE